MDGKGEEQYGGITSSPSSRSHEVCDCGDREYDITQIEKETTSCVDDLSYSTPILNTADMDGVRVDEREP